ncbi:hypothetical protein PRVXH_002373 [Proteinivorax hydrogeniformans]|uniref:ECF transporter S component n=2 Tax=Proteinivorax TaxID=1491776 RepID=A0AAU7VKD8_9FIRM
MGRHKHVRFITQTGILLAITLTFQMLGLPQMVTGIVVNAMLVLAALSVGIYGSIIVGGLTPLIAFIRGILPPILGPVIPFIIISNWALIIIFMIFYKRNKFIAVACSSFGKFLILTFVVRLIVDIPPEPAAMLQLPQLFTATLGGILAITIWPAIKRNIIK